WRYGGWGGFGNLLGLDLGQRGQQGEQDIAHKFIIGGQVRLGIAVKAHPVGSEPLQVHDRRHHAFAVKRSSAQNRTQSNLRLWASSNSAANCLRPFTPFLPLSLSTYS